MGNRTIEQISIGAIVALVAAIINQAVAGKVDYWWLVGGFFGAIIIYGGYQGFGGYPFTKYRVTNVRDNKALLFRSDILEGKRIEGAWQFRASKNDWAIYGPYLRNPLRKGKYCATFRIKVDDIAGENCPIVDIDVASRTRELGDKRLTARTLTPLDFRRGDEYHEFSLDFNTFGDERDLELRVYSRGNGHLVTLDYIQLSRRLI